IASPRRKPPTRRPNQNRRGTSVIVGSKWLAIALVVATANAASAQSTSAADEAFRQGRELLKAGKWAEACEQFDKSQSLDPQLGTVVNIGQCSEHINRLATAAAAYRELVAKDSKEDRKAVAKERLAAIERRIPTLIVKIAAPPAGLTVSLDSKAGPRD